MAFQKMTTQPALRDEKLPEDVIAPGLYPGEVAVRIDMAAFNNPPVAVSADMKRLGNGAGVAITAWARAIKTDGESRVDRHGQDIETATTANFTPEDVKQYGARPLAKEVMLLVMGEPPQLSRADGKPVLDVPDAVRLNASIREAIATVVDTGPAEDAGAILGV